MAEQSAPIILVPGFWLGAWAWDEVADKLRADGHDVTALTLPGMESKDADRSEITFEDHVNAIIEAVEAAGAPVVLTVHSATGFTGYAASDRVPERIAAMVYVDTAPGIAPLDPSFEDVEKPMVWTEIEEEENLDGLSEEQKETFRQRAIPVPGHVLRDSYELTNDARRDIPSTLICTAFTAEQYQTYAKQEPGDVIPRRHPRAPQRHLGRPADQPLADVVATDRDRADHRRRREGSRRRRSVSVTDGISARQFRESDGVEDWRVLADGAYAFFRTESFSAGSRLVGAIGELPDIDDHHPDVDLRRDGVTVRLITISDDYFGMSRRDVDLARRISALARDLGATADPSSVQAFLIIPGAPVTAEVMPFWEAVLGYRPRGDSSGRGPRGSAGSRARLLVRADGRAAPRRQRCDPRGGLGAR